MSSRSRIVGVLFVLGAMLLATTPAGLALPTGIWGLAQSEFSWPSALATAVLGTFGTGLAYVVHLGNTGRLGSTRASTTTYLIPGVSIILGMAVLGEEVASTQRAFSKGPEWRSARPAVGRRRNQLFEGSHVTSHTVSLSLPSVPVSDRH